jgi:hypothetical protein
MLTLELLGASQREVEAPQTIWVGRAKGEVIDTEDAHARAQSKSATASPSQLLAGKAITFV